MYTNNKHAFYDLRKNANEYYTAILDNEIRRVYGEQLLIEDSLSNRHIQTAAIAYAKFREDTSLLSMQLTDKDFQRYEVTAIKSGTPCILWGKPENHIIKARIADLAVLFGANDFRYSHEMDQTDVTVADTAITEEKLYQKTNAKSRVVDLYIARPSLMHRVRKRTRRQTLT